MQTITTIGLDIAKSVFQVHGIDAGGQVVIRRQLKRRHVLTFFEKLPPFLLGIEACASWHLPGTDRAGQLRDVKGWESGQHVMQSRSIRRSGQPTCAKAFLM